MKPKNLIPFIGIFLCCFTTSFAQDTVTKHRVARYLSIAFPSQPDSIVVRGQTVFVVNEEGVSYQVLTNNEIINVKSERDFKRAMEGAVKGYLKSATAKLFKHTTHDTTIGGAKGKLMHLFDGDGSVAISDLTSFLTIQDNRLVVIQVALTDESSADRDRISAFFESAEFHGKNYESNVSSAFDVGYKIGYYFVPVVLLILLVVFIVRRINNKNRRDRNRSLTGSL